MRPFFSPHLSYRGAASAPAFFFLVTTLVVSEYRARFRQTWLGPLWHFFQPLATTAALCGVFLGLLGKTATSPLFYFAGVLVWSFFSQVVSSVGTCFSTYAPIYSKVSFPRMAVPLALLSSKVPVGLAQVLVLAIAARILPSGHSFSLLAALHALILCATSAFAFGLIVASLSVRYLDLQHGLGFIFQVLLFVSPVVYPAQHAVERVGLAYYLNPLATAIELIRDPSQIPGTAILLSWVVVTGLLLFSVHAFARAERVCNDG